MFKKFSYDPELRLSRGEEHILASLDDYSSKCGSFRKPLYDYNCFFKEAENAGNM